MVESHDESTHQISLQPSEMGSIIIQVVDGPNRGMRSSVPQGGLRVGTAPSCQLRLTDMTVSRIHCELELRRDGVRLRDGGSTNGTFVEGARVRDVDLAPGATFRLGSSTLRVLAGEEPMQIPISSLDRLGDLVGSSVEMRRVYAMIEKVAPTSATALIQGDTGTGKELVARAIHRYSPRKDGAFVAVDCGAIAPNVIESELFGHVRGAFSGAVVDRRGLFEEADNGTLFLDEIGELPLILQAKLLRTLETREIRKVGANAVRKVNVRLIAATNRPLAESVNDGSFREELYYRLAVVEIRLPPLHARRGDIPMLAQHFYRQFTNRDEQIPEELLSVLLTRSWPGNVREMRNFVERCLSLGWEAQPTADGERKAGHIPGLEHLVPVHLPLKEARQAWIEQFESAYVNSQLTKTGGNITRAAEAAGVSRRFFQRLMARLGMRSGEAGDDDGSSGDDDGDLDADG
jgi:DNA-binding NtrC family response regulator